MNHLNNGQDCNGNNTMANNFFQNGLVINEYTLDEFLASNSASVPSTNVSNNISNQNSFYLQSGLNLSKSFNSQALNLTNIPLQNIDASNSEVSVDTELSNFHFQNKSDHKVNVSNGIYELNNSIELKTQIKHTKDSHSKQLFESQDNQSNNHSPKNENVKEALSSKKKFTCPKCGKRLLSKHLYEVHARLHEKLKTYKCAECSLTFNCKSNLAIHIRLHTGERPYMCGLCGKTFVQSSHVYSHIRTHSALRDLYECDKCKKCYTTNASLRTHMKIHTGDLSFKCELCFKKFIKKSYLVDHLKSHSSNKQFSCEKCGKKFRDKSYVAKHSKNFCGNDGYNKRWLRTDVVLPKSRKCNTRKRKKSGKFFVGRPKKRKLSKYKRKSAAIRKNMETKSLNESNGTINKEQLLQSDESLKNNEAMISLSACLASESTHLKIACTESSITEKAPNSKIQNKEDTQCSKNVNISSFPFNLGSVSDNNSILNLTQPENLSLHAFSQSQNIDFSSNQIFSNLSQKSSQNFINFNEPYEAEFNQSFRASCEPQNLSLSNSTPSANINSLFSQPENLSVHQSTSNFSSQQLISTSYSCRNISNGSHLQPENLSLPQNLSVNYNKNHEYYLTKGIFAQPCNLSQNPVSYFQTSHLIQDSIKPKNLSKNVQSHKFSQNNSAEPQNLSLVDLSESMKCQKNQPQNLSLLPNVNSEKANNFPSQNISFFPNMNQNDMLKSANISEFDILTNVNNQSSTADMNNKPQNLSYEYVRQPFLSFKSASSTEPQNLTTSHGGVGANSVTQPQNLSQNNSVDHNRNQENIFQVPNCFTNPQLNRNNESNTCFQGTYEYLG